MPFEQVAEAELGRGYSTIRRSDRERVVNVTAEVDETRVTPNEILADLGARVMPTIDPRA